MQYFAITNCLSIFFMFSTIATTLCLIASVLGHYYCHYLVSALPYITSSIALTGRRFSTYESSSFLMPIRIINQSILGHTFYSPFYLLLLHLIFPYNNNLQLQTAFSSKNNQDILWHDNHNSRQKSTIKTSPNSRHKNMGFLN